MASSDNGGQIFTLDYKNPRTSQSVNKLIYKTIPSGIMGPGTEQATFVKVSDTSITVSPFVCYFEDNTTKITVRIETVSNAAVVVSSSTPYVIVRFLWKNIEENYADIMAVAYGDIGSDDIILGRCHYATTTLLTTFDYSRRKICPLYNLNLKYSTTYNLHLTANEPVDRTVVVSAGKILVGSSIVSFAGGTSANLSDPTGNRYDVVTIDSSGAIVVIEGTNSGGFPEIPFDHVYVGYVYRTNGRTDVRGYDIGWGTSYERLIPQMEKSPTFRNKLTNGDFRIWQRGTSVSGVTGNIYFLADRWRMSLAGTSAAAVYSRIARTVGDRITGFSSEFYARVNITNGGDATNGVIRFSQCIEDVMTLEGRMATLTIWAASAFPNTTVCIKQNFGTGGSPSAEVRTLVGEITTLSATISKFTFTFLVPSITGKTIGTDGLNTSYLAVEFFLSTGSATTYASCGIQTGLINFVNVQLEEGRTSTNFEELPNSIVSERCQRYCRILTNGVASHRLLLGFNHTTTLFMGNIHTSIPMRIIPTFVTPDVTKFSVTDGTTATACSAVSVSATQSSTSEIEINATMATHTQWRPTFLTANATSSVGYLEADYTV